MGLERLGGRAPLLRGRRLQEIIKVPAAAPLLEARRSRTERTLGGKSAVRGGAHRQGPGQEQAATAMNAETSKTHRRFTRNSAYHGFSRGSLRLRGAE